MASKKKATANDRQHGGDHYKKMEYEHWDWVCDAGLPYLIGCATKYVARWRNKNGKEDLEKALHYVQKAQEREVEARPSWRSSNTRKFIAQLEDEDAQIIDLICKGDWEEATARLQFLML